MTGIFRRNHWGKIKQFQVPCSVFKDDQLVLSPKALALLLVLYETAKKRVGTKADPFATIPIGQSTLIERTGYSKNVITEAAKELDATGFIKRTDGNRRRRGEFGVNKYVLCNPSTGEPLETTPGVRLLFNNDVPYLNLPVCFVQESEANWSLAKLSGSELALYVSLAFLANRKGQSEFEIDPLSLRKLCNLTKPTFKSALDGLETRGLIWTNVAGNEITLCDPYIGEPVHNSTGDPEDDPANYYVTGKDGRSRRVDLSSVDSESAKRWIQSCLPKDALVVSQKNGDFKICCPFHEDVHPSCSVSPSKRCFYCFGCKKKGTITQLAMQLRSVSKGAVIKERAHVAGAECEYADPDYKAEAIYSYRDNKGNLVKQVLRYPGKQFRQRRPAKGGGWVWNTQGVKPVLYNLWIYGRRTVCVTEGEKDADRVTNLHMRDDRGDEIVAITSGGADTWSDELADDLLYNRVIVMPDADEAGKKYAEAVVQSLRKRGIEYCVATFDDVGAKDVSEFLDQGHTVIELADRLGPDWAEMAKREASTTPAESPEEQYII